MSLPCAFVHAHDNFFIFPKSQTQLLLERILLTFKSFQLYAYNMLYIMLKFGRFL
jgi:hypothetical protein